MPLDPSIPLQARGPQIDSPTDVLGKVLAMRAQQQQQQIQQQTIASNDFILKEKKRAAEGDDAQAKLLTANTAPDPETGLTKTDHQKVFQGLVALGYADRAEHYLSTADANEKNLNALQLNHVTLTHSLYKLQGDMLAQVLEVPPERRAAAWQVQRANLQVVFQGQPEMLKGIPPEYPGDEAAQQLANLGRTQEEKLANALKAAEARKADADAKKGAAEAANIEKYGSATPPSLQSENVMVNGKPTQVTFNPRSGKRTMIDAAGLEVDVTGKTAPIPPASTIINPQAVTDVKEAVTGMREGTIPPMLPGRASKEYLATMAEAHRQGYDLQAAVTDWNATQKHVASMNNAQQLRLNQSINALPELLDSVDALASKWHGGRFPILNKTNLALAKGGAYGEDVATVARQLDSQIADVTADLGNVYMGGNSPTDHALQLAGKSLSGDWSETVLHDMVKLARGNVTIRQNSIKHTGVQGASATNPYAPPVAPPPPNVADPLGILQ